MICSHCNNETPKLYSAVVDNEYVTDRCSNCLQTKALPASSTRADYRKRRQQENHREDMIQPWSDQHEPNPEFVKSYPEKAQDYYTKEQIRKALRT